MVAVRNRDRLSLMFIALSTSLNIKAGIAFLPSNSLGHGTTYHRALPNHARKLSPPSVVDLPRGGDSVGIGGMSSTTALNSVTVHSLVPAAVEAALQSGPYGVLALTGVASCAVVPLTLYRQGWSFSVGYGFSVFTMGLVLYNTFKIGLLSVTSPLSLLALAVMFYGARLSSFLLLREMTVPSKAEQIKSFNKSAPLKRIPFAVAVSMFYAFMTSPLMFAARGGAAATIAAGSTKSTIMNAGVTITWFGAIMEAITDYQKLLAKRANPDDESTFVGPTDGFYKLCRHPNYLAELVYWFGLTIAGSPTFGKNIIAWICSSFGLYGIYGIMTGASKRLDGKQDEKYAGQEKYDKYKSDVPASLWPWTS